MKYILIIICLLFIIILCSCNLHLLQAETTLETIVVTETVVVEDIAKISQLQDQILEKNEEIQAYQNLIVNLNDLLACVYYGYASNDKYMGNFTAFSLEYGNKYYLITAGHCVHYKYGGIDTKYTNFKFKANFTDKWIYPKLLKYEFNNNYNIDYAIFYSDKIDKGLKYNLENTFPKYFLKDCRINEYNILKTKSGDSGSPIINLNGEVIEILTGDFQDIDYVINILNLL